ncbi:MAG: T9SS type A sorting domain-containing protein [Ferruginibacter sp.]
MQLKSTLDPIIKLPRQVFMILFLFILVTSVQAQTYTNGNLSTGATANDGTAAPTGTTWSEVQNDAGVTTISNTASGIVSSLAANVSVADDFTIPPGEAWTISKLIFYAYQTGAPATPTPFNDLRVQIHNSDPSTGTSTVLFGDLTTNRLSASNDALMYRIFNTLVPTPTASGTTRKIWTLEANVTGLTLQPGTYWIEWQTGVTSGNHFSPPNTPVGARTVPGSNAMQHDLTANEWGLVQDPGNPPALLDTVEMDMPFKINYTASCAGTPVPGATLSTAVSVCAGTPFTLSVANPTSVAGITYQWQSSATSGGPYANIAGATSATLTTTQTAATYYQLVVTCSGSPGTSTPVQVGIIASPAVTASPVSVTVCSGTNTSFTATATGASLTYQWQVSTDNGTTFTDISNGGIYGGATTNSLTLTNVPFANNGYQYQVVVSVTGCGSVTSGIATLTVNEAATIGTQPANVTACVGNDATFTTTATGSALTYQWQVSTNGGATFTPIAGATSATLVVPAVTSGMNNNQYNVIVSNACVPAGVTSTNAILTVSNVATITTSPVNTTVCEGANASFTAVASAVTYQWQVSTDGGANFTDIAGETSLNLTLTAVTPSMDGNQYRLVAFSCGAAGLNSAAATLTVNDAASITTQPADLTACIGNNANFSTTAGASSTPLTYQWEVSTDGGATYTPIAGATTANLTVPGVTAAMNGNLYHVILSNGCTASLISNAATLTVASVAVITAQPVDASTCEGSNATFSVTATGSITGYMWQESTDGGANFVTMSGQTAATLTLSAVTASMNNNQYRVMVLDNCTATGVTSDPATLTVNALPAVTISATSTAITTQMTTDLTATSTPPSTVFSWFKDGVLISGATGATITVTHDELGDYYATVTDVNGCSNTSNTLTITDSTASNAFIYPNPGRGIFNLVFDQSTPGVTNRVGVGAFDSKGSRVYQKQFNLTTPIQTIPIDLSNLAKGVYVLEITDAAGVRIRTDRIVIY